MDREAIITSIKYNQLIQQHFNGGYFSDAVRKEAEKLTELNEEDKKAFFKLVFNKVWETVSQVETHGRQAHYGETEIDLSHEGLGTVSVEAVIYSEEEARNDDISPYKGISLSVDSFYPVPDRHEEWINSPGDDLGLETNGPTMVTDDHEPEGWGECIFAEIDGSYPTDSDISNISYEIMRLLDAKETLKLVTESLGITG